MTDVVNSRGHRNELDLLAHLGELRGLTDELRAELPHVNDAHLHPTIATLVDTADVVFEAHGADPKPSIADDLSVLMSAVRALKIPLNDPDLGRTPTLERLRKSKGLIVAGLADALDSAAAIGLHPQKPPIASEVAASLPRSDVEGLLDGILKRLTQVEKSLDALDEAKALPTGFTQQNGLLNFYTSSMRVEIDLAKLHLTVGDKAVDFNALTRAVETMAGLTSDFVATVRAWGSRVAEQVVLVAGQVPQQVRKVTTGVKASARWVMRVVRRRKRNATHGDDTREFEREIDETATPEEPPPNFDINRIRDMILAGQAPPRDWMPQITVLDFRRTELRDLAPLAGLASLQSLVLDGTQVSDLAPLAGLARLQTLVLDGTQVSDLAPLAGLASLERLVLDGTQVSDLAPLAGLGSLQTLYLQGTQVSDLAPLAGLASLQWLYLQGTQVSDLAPLAGLASLQLLVLQGTQVSDLAPLAGLARLLTLVLQGTQVSDLAPLAGLASLQSLDLQGTQVSDLEPVAHVAEVAMPNGSIMRRAEGRA